MAINTPNDAHHLPRRLCRCVCTVIGSRRVSDPCAGGDLTFFKVERTDGSAMPYIDVLACGNGQYGGLGNAQYSNAQGAPVRAKNVSGLLECKFNSVWETLARIGDG